MRPQSDLRVIISAVLIDGGGTTRQIAQRTNGSVSQTREALNNMCRSGDAAKTRSIRVRGVRRPVPWYERADRAAGQPCRASPMHDLIATWSRCALPAQTMCEASM